MESRIVLDLDDDGEIVITASAGRAAGELREGLAETGLREAAVRGAAVVRAKASELLMKPLAGLGRHVAAALAALVEDERYALDQFSLELSFNLEAEAGGEAGAPVLAKASLRVVPSGAFKATYTWKRRTDGRQGRAAGR